MPATSWPRVMALIGSGACLVGAMSPYTPVRFGVSLWLATFICLSSLGLWLVWVAGRSPALRATVAMAVVLWSTVLFTTFHLVQYALTQRGGPGWVQSLSIIWPQYVFFWATLVGPNGRPILDEPLMASAVSIATWGVIAVGFSFATRSIKSFAALLALAYVAVAVAVVTIVYVCRFCRPGNPYSGHLSFRGLDYPSLGH